MQHDTLKIKVLSLNSPVLHVPGLGNLTTHTTLLKNHSKAIFTLLFYIN